MSIGYSTPASSTERRVNGFEEEAELSIIEIKQRTLGGTAAGPDQDDLNAAIANYWRLGEEVSKRMRNLDAARGRYTRDRAEIKRLKASEDLAVSARLAQRNMIIQAGGYV